MSDQMNTVVRPMHVGARDIQTREISGLAEASGSGTETGLTPTGVLSVDVNGSGVYGFPGVEFYSESGGGLAVTILFYSSTGALITSSSAGSTAGAAVVFTDYTIPAANPTNSGPAGTHYSAWKTLSVPIPSGTVGYLAGGFCGALMSFYESTYYPTGSDNGTVNLYLELGDSGVAASSLHLASMAFSTGYYGKASATHEEVTCNYQYTAPSLIAQVRGKAVSTAPSEQPTPWVIGITSVWNTE